MIIFRIFSMMFGIYLLVSYAGFPIAVGVLLVAMALAGDE